MNVSDIKIGVKVRQISGAYNGQIREIVENISIRELVSQGKPVSVRADQVAIGFVQRNKNMFSKA